MPPVRIRLEPLGTSFTLETGAPLRDPLFAYGVEFPCGGRGKCRRCRIRVVDGGLAITDADALLLTPAELEAGWRLACRARAPREDATLAVGQWDAAILADDTAFAFTPRDGYGIAVDLGTTTIVAQLLELQTARVLAVRSALNPQAAHGADIMTRVGFAVAGGRRELERLARNAVRRLVMELIEAARVERGSLRRIVIVGNAVMHHLFCGLDVEPLSHVPFESPHDGLVELPAAEFAAPAVFLACLGGFVGSDILAGILASRLHESDQLTGLIDLGTNGEIVVGTRERIVCASAAAGPAFEGGKISCGMRAATGAISEVTVEAGALRCHVLGDGEPRGICGSGLVDAAAAGLDLGVLRPNGRLRDGVFPLCGAVSLTQRDIRELQLAKAAVAAGVQILLERLGARHGDVARLYLAGAFGNYVNRASARRIGLIDFPDSKVEPAGNTALLGAKMALYADDLGFAATRARIEHVGLASDGRFQESYVGEMPFPQT